MRPVALDELFASIVLDIEPQARAKGLSLTWRRSGLSVVSDPLMLRRILQNLLVNAVQYTEKGGIRLLARRRGPDVRIEVWDTGPGIGEADREMIFEEFQRGSATDRPAIGGFGLGPVDRAAHGRGARASARSMLARSATAPAFRSPHLGPTAAAATPTATAPAALNFSVSALTMASRSPSSTTTRPCSMRCRGCSNAGTARFAARAISPASSRAAAPTASGPIIILADYHLDYGSNGLDAVHALRVASGVAIPAIIITADRTPAIADAAREMGCEILLKPVKPAELRALMLHLLARAAQAVAG